MPYSTQTYSRVLIMYLFSNFSGSHVVTLLVERYPEYFVINLDKVRTYPNFCNRELSCVVVQPSASPSSPVNSSDHRFDHRNFLSFKYIYLHMPLVYRHVTKGTSWIYLCNCCPVYMSGVT